MRTRPWPLVILAIIQVYTPLISILFNAWILKVNPTYVIRWIFERGGLEAFQTLALMPIAGIAIWTMKSWSYPVFFVAILWSGIRNFMNMPYATGVMPTAILFLVYAFQILLVGYLLLPRVRRTYFDPTVRWWESKPRYVLELEADLKVGNRKHSAEMLNISEGGAFLATKGDVSVGDSVTVSFLVLGQLFTGQGKIVHTRKMDDGRDSYGVQFDHTQDSERRFRGLAMALSQLDFQDRGRNLKWAESLQDWLTTLVKTGRGLLPEPQKRGAKSKKKTA